MGKSIVLSALLLGSTLLSAQTEIHNAQITGTVSIGNQEVTSILDLETDCIYKSELHGKGMFVKDEQVQLEFSATTMLNKEQGRVIKPNLSKDVLVHKNGCSQNNGNKFIGINTSITTECPLNFEDSNPDNVSRLKDFQWNMDIVARSLIDLTNDQLFKDIVANLAKNAPKETDYEVLIYSIESEYNIKQGKNLLQSMLKSLINNSGTGQEIAKLPKIYKEFEGLNGDKLSVMIFAPFFNADIFNSTLINNNTPKYIGFNHLYNPENSPSYQIGNVPSISFINENNVTTSLTWLVSTRVKSFGITEGENPYYTPSWFEKCGCLNIWNGVEFTTSCVIGMGEACGRMSFGRCRGAGCVKIKH